MTVGNVCPARFFYVPGYGKPKTGPHEPAEGFDSVLAPFSRPVKMQRCKHCGGFYGEPTP